VLLPLCSSEEEKKIEERRGGQKKGREQAGLTLCFSEPSPVRKKREGARPVLPGSGEEGGERGRSTVRVYLYRTVASQRGKSGSCWSAEGKDYVLTFSSDREEGFQAGALRATGCQDKGQGGKEADVTLSSPFSYLACLPKRIERSRCLVRLERAERGEEKKDPRRFLLSRHPSAAQKRKK